ncbi:MAG: 1-deoxy-D-xylulose-5-phosphate reductoisomerase, partial [Gemmatimonadetes bacterium]|nr:1-deoxy-D-xylulose-5-phosphate reductoisomerase [Gemmatimonadota bacterium]
MPNTVILGCTGSIGDSTFRVLEGLGEEYQVAGLSGGRNVAKLLERAQTWKPQIVCTGEVESTGALREELPGTRVVGGEEGLLELATMPEADMIINGLVGGVGLKPTLAALEAGKTVAMANKEPLIMA